MSVIMHYKSLAIHSTEKSGDTFLVNCRYTQEDKHEFYIVPLQKNEFTVHMALDPFVNDGLFYDSFIDEQGDILVCLQWCEDYYRETYIEEFLKKQKRVSIYEVCRTFSIGAYIAILENNRGKWEVVIEDKHNKVILREKGFAYAFTALDWFACWYWNTGELKNDTLPATTES